MMAANITRKPFGRRVPGSEKLLPEANTPPAQAGTRPVTAPPICREIHSQMISYLDRDGKMQMGDFISIIGAVGGFSAQRAVWRCLIEPQQRNAGDYLNKVDTKQGDTLYFGISINLFLMSAMDVELSFYSLAGGKVPKEGHPPLGEIVKYVTGMLQPDFAAVRLPQQHGKFLQPRAALDTHWGWIEKSLLASGHPATQWPAILGLVAQWIIRGANDKIPPPVALKLMMETAVFMSKVDPRSVPGATAGLHPPANWANRALIETEKVGREVVSHLPKQLVQIH